MSFSVGKSIRTRRTALAAMCLIAGAFFTGCHPGSVPNFTTPVITDSADYTIDEIRIFPPPPGDLGNGTVTVIIEFTLNGNTGNVSPIVWVWEHDPGPGDNFPPQPGSSEDLGNANPHEGAISLSASGKNTLQTTFEFTCGGTNGDEVIGPNGRGTGEGHWVSFPPQVKWDDAEISAAVARQNPSGSGVVQSMSEWRSSRKIDMSCAEDPPNSGHFYIQHSP